MERKEAKTKIAVNENDQKSSSQRQHDIHCLIRFPSPDSKTRHKKQQCSKSQSNSSTSTRNASEVKDFPLWESPTECRQNVEEFEDYDKVDHVSILLVMGREDSCENADFSTESIFNEAREVNNDTLANSGEKSVWLKRRKAAIEEGRFEEKEYKYARVDQNGFPIT
jgi:hypothetical protein